MMVVSSDLEEIFLTADRIVVLRAGAVIRHCRSAETREEEVPSVAIDWIIATINPHTRLFGVFYGRFWHSYPNTRKLLEVF